MITVCELDAFRLSNISWGGRFVEFANFVKDHLLRSSGLVHLKLGIKATVFIAHSSASVTSTTSVGGSLNSCFFFILRK